MPCPHSGVEGAEQPQPSAHALSNGGESRSGLGAELEVEQGGVVEARATGRGRLPRDARQHVQLAGRIRG